MANNGTQKESVTQVNGTQPPPTEGEIGPWILHVFTSIEDRLESTRKNVIRLMILAGIMTFMVLVAGFFAQLLIRPLWAKILEKLFPG